VGRVMTEADLLRLITAYEHRSRGDMGSDSIIIVEEKNAQLPGLIRDVGFMTDWIQKDVEGVGTVFTKLRGRARIWPKDQYYLTGIEISVSGRDLNNIQRRIQQELDKRAFMYADYYLDLRESDDRVMKRVLLTVSPRPRSYFTDDETTHDGTALPELEQRVSEVLGRVSKKTHMSAVVDRFLWACCKCQQIKSAINLIELALTWNNADPQELLAAEMCLRSLCDLRVGTSLLSLWESRDVIRPLWRQESDRDEVFISQVYEWFRDLRDMRCHTLVLAEHVPETEGLD